MSITGTVLQSVLKSQGRTQHQLAAALRIAPSSITHIVTGRRQTIDAALSGQLSSVLGTPPDFWRELHEAEAQGTAKPAAFYIEKLGNGGEPSILPGVLVDHQIRMLVKTNCDDGRESDIDGLVIEEFDADRVRASSYDTTIGGYWEDGREAEMPHDVNGTLIVKPQSRLKVYTKEYFRMPATIHGRIAPAGSFLRSGIVVAHGPIIDPYFEGRLTVTLHNFYQKAVEIPTTAAFLTIIFEKLSSSPASPRRLIVSPTGDPEFEDTLSKREEILMREIEAIRAARRKS